jgi:hypothetical protein
VEIDQRASWVRVYRLIFGLLGVAALVYQLSESTARVNFFSFFTVQSNIIAAVVLLIGAIAMPAATRTWDLIRGGAAMHMILTGVVYNTLLTGLEGDLQTPDPWVNETLHMIIPIVMLVDFLIVPLAHRISVRDALTWTIYPLTYLAYTLIRGPIAEWYPYPFLDPRKDGGYGRVALYCIAILIGFLAVTWAMTAFNSWRLNRSQR